MGWLRWGNAPAGTKRPGAMAALGRSGTGYRNRSPTVRGGRSSVRNGGRRGERGAEGGNLRGEWREELVVEDVLKDAYQWTLHAGHRDLTAGQLGEGGHGVVGQAARNDGVIPR